MKKLDNGARAQKIKLSQVISKTLTAVTLAASCQMALAQSFDSGSETNKAQILGMELSTKIPGQYIVVFKDSMVNSLAAPMVRSNMSLAEARAIVVREMGIELVTKTKGEMTRIYSNAINGILLDTDVAAASVEKLLEDPRVAFIEADQQVSLSATQNNATWGLDRIDQANLPLNSTYNYDFNGTGVNAYIVDTGVRITHNNFGNRGNAGFTAINDGRGSNDCNGHGTHVAGTVGSSTYGVAKNVQIHAVRVLGCNGSGSNSGVIAGIDWVAANHIKPAVANMSLGGGASTATDNAVNSAVAQGITMVVAAGNDNRDACSFSPARAANAITVGSTTSADRRSSFSNFGTCLDIYAPGSSITSTWSTSNSATNTISGTSMAAPHVAGVAALYLDEFPNASPSQVESAIESAAIPNKISDARTGSPNLLLNNFSEGNNGGGGGGNNDNFFENTNNVTISSTSATTVSSNINVTRTGASGTITVKADIKHTWRGDLEVKIFAPNGASGTVHAQTNPNDSGDDLLLDVNLNAGTIESSGTWRLEVTDTFAQDGGFIDSWSIEFQ